MKKPLLTVEELVLSIKQGIHPLGIARRTNGKELLTSITTNCVDGSIAERIYWIKKDLLSRPNCANCKTLLEKKSFINGGALGYHEFCSKSCSSSAESRRDHTSRMSMAKYGVDHPLKSQKVQARRAETNLSRYGVGNPMKWSGEKFRKIMLERYDGVNSLTSPSLKPILLLKINKIKRANYVEFLYEEAEKYNSLTLLSDLTVDYQGQDSKVRWSCKKCEAIIWRSFRNPHCVICNPNHSKPQAEIAQYLTELCPELEIITNDRTQITPFELDIFIPSLKIAIELNGGIWHSTMFKDDKKYHLHKTLACEQAGIRLFHFWDFQWSEHRKLIESKLAVLIGRKITKIYARDCEIGAIPIPLADKILLASHLQGTALSTYAVALFHQGLIVGVMTFAPPRFNKKYQWELIRYATLPYYQIVGGASRALALFKKRLHPLNLISYADRLISRGQLYEKLGMSRVNETAPGYFYLNRNYQRISRYRAMKKKLSKLLKSDVDLSLTEEEIMKQHGFYRVYDAGQLVYAADYSLANSSNPLSINMS